MKRRTNSLIVKLIFLSLFVTVACSNHNGKTIKSTDRGDSTSLDNTDYEDVAPTYSSLMMKSQERMNELRFRNWSGRQWLDNDYAKALRDSLDLYDVNGNYSGESDFVNIAYAKEKFVVLDSEPSSGGGLVMAFVFEGHWDAVYLAWVFSTCEEYVELLMDESVVEEILKSANPDVEEEDYKLPTDIIIDRLKDKSNLHWRHDVRAIIKSDQESNETAASVKEHMETYGLSWR